MHESAGFYMFPTFQEMHIKYCEPQTDISCINADYRRMTPREVPHVTRGAAWDHLQAMLGVDRLFV